MRRRTHHHCEPQRQAQPQPQPRRPQVYTAEERAALALINYEEKKAKEDKVITEMRRLVEQTLEGKDGTAASQKFNA